MPRRLRFPVRERIDAGGRVLVPLDEACVATLVGRLTTEGIEALGGGWDAKQVLTRERIEETPRSISSLFPPAEGCKRGDDGSS